MKKTLSVLLFGMLFLFAPNAVHAQMGWQWGRAGLGNASVDVLQMVTDNIGNTYVAGSVYDTMPSYIILGADTVFNNNNATTNTQFIITKVDSSGNFIWSVATTYGAVYSSSMVTDLAGNLYFTASYMGSFGIDTFNLTDTTTGYAMFMAKISPAGTLLWLKNVVPNGDYPDGILATDYAGNVYLAAEFLSQTLTIGDSTFHSVYTGGDNAFLAKYDPNGNPIWARHFGTLGSETPVSLSSTWKGDVYLAGYYDGDTMNICGIPIYGDTAMYTDPGSFGNNFFAKFDSSGNIKWAQYLSYHILLEASATDVRKNIYLTGAIDTTFTWGTTIFKDTGGTDAFVAKFDSSGNLKWAQTAGGIGDECTFGMSIDNCGKVWLCGRDGYPNPSGYAMYFGSDSLVYSWDTSMVFDPMFIAEYDTAGNYISSQVLPSGSDDYVGMAVDNKGNFYVGGDNYYVGMPLSFGPDILGNTGNEEYLFVAKYRYDPVVCDCSGSPIFPSFTSTGTTTTITFTYTGTTAYDSLVWNFGDGTTSDVISPVHSYSAAGTYHVCVYLYSTCLPLDKPYVIYCKEINTVTGVANINNAAGVNIYPNPAKDECTIHSDVPFLVGTSMVIYNITGQAVDSRQLTGNDITIPLAGVAPGIYNCRIITEGNVAVIKKLVIIK